MPLYGTDFDKIIDLKSDNSYSPYFDTAKKNRLIREATNKAIDLKVASNDRIQVQDDLFGIFKSNVTYTPTTNTVDLIAGGTGISDYYHMMNLKAKFVVPLAPNYITQALNTSPLRIQLNKDSNLRTGEQVVVSGVTTNTNANGTRYLKMMNHKKYQLYSDVNLITPIIGNGIYNGTSGSISRVVYNYAKDYHSNRKFSTLNEPDVYNPYYEIASTVVKVYPLSWVCSEVTVDYVSVPVYIDVTDASIDLLETYSTRFIDYLADKVCELMGESSRDDGLIMNTSQELQQP